MELNESSEPLEVPEFISLAQEIPRPPDSIKGEQMRQAKWTFNLAITMGAIGTLIVLAGAALLMIGALQTDKAGLAAASGIVTDVLSVFAIKFHRETNNRLDEIRRDEHIFMLVGQIGDPTTKDQAIDRKSVV